MVEPQIEVLFYCITSCFATILIMINIASDKSQSRIFGWDTSFAFPTHRAV